jgi:hypothetical protein
VRNWWTHFAEVAGGEVVVEKGVFGEHREPERLESAVEQVDDDDLGCDEEPSQLVGGHRLRATCVVVLVFGGWAKTSRKSFSSSLASSRSAATALSSSQRFMRTR